MAHLNPAPPLPPPPLGTRHVNSSTSAAPISVSSKDASEGSVTGLCSQYPCRLGYAQAYGGGAALYPPHEVDDHIMPAEHEQRRRRGAGLLDTTAAALADGKERMRLDENAMPSSQRPTLRSSVGIVSHLFRSHRLRLPLTLFALGYFVSLLIVHLQMGHRVTLYHKVVVPWLPTANGQGQDRHRDSSHYYHHSERDHGNVHDTGAGAVEGTWNPGSEPPSSPNRHQSSSYAEYPSPPSSTGPGPASPPQYSASPVAGAGAGYSITWLPLIGGVSAVLVGFLYLTSDVWAHGTVAPWNCPTGLYSPPPYAANSAGLVWPLAPRVPISDFPIGESEADDEDDADEGPIAEEAGAKEGEGKNNSNEIRTEHEGDHLRNRDQNDGEWRPDHHPWYGHEESPYPPDHRHQQLQQDQEEHDRPPLIAVLHAGSGSPSRAVVRSKRGVILRCLGALTGINYAVTKIPQSTVVLALALLALALAVHWSVDRTRRGLVISLFVAVVGSGVCHVLTQRGLVAFVMPDVADSFQSWVPVLLFASAVCFGSAARTLARGAQQGAGGVTREA